MPRRPGLTNNVSSGLSILLETTVPCGAGPDRTVILITFLVTDAGYDISAPLRGADGFDGLPPNPTPSEIGICSSYTASEKPGEIQTDQTLGIGVTMVFRSD